MNENREEEESYECFIFCSKHLECGKRDLKQGGKDRIMPRNPAIVEKERLRKMVGETHANRKRGKQGHSHRKDDEEVNDKDMHSEDDDDEDVDLADEALEGGGKVSR